jgi:hypothetical protein
MSKHDAAVEEHLGEVAQTELVAQAPQHHQTDYIGRILHAVEERACTLIEPACAAPTAKAAVAPGGQVGTLRSSGRVAVRVWHLALPPKASILLSIMQIANWRET